MLRRHHLVLAALAGVLVAAGADPAIAQTQASPDLFVGFSTLRETGTASGAASEYDRGWVVSGAVPIPWRLAAVGEVGSNWRTNIVGETQRLTAVLGGVRVTPVHASRAAVFGQALVGVERFSEPGFDESGVAVQPGAGIDVLFGPLGVRGQVDWRLTTQNDVTYKEVRFAVGLVLVPGR